MERLKEFNAEKGMKCQFATPAAPHQNGSTESLVKCTKIALKEEQVLTPFEFYTCLLEVANFINQRPIGRIPMTPMMGPTCDLMKYSSVNIRQQYHKDRSEKPTIHATEQNLCRK